MSRSYRAVMDGVYENHLLPFLWMKGEDHATITAYLEKIAGADIHEVCLESRTHPDFCGDGWWRDLRFVIDECRRLGMKIWILDDAHFPTGFANGRVKEHPERSKTVLTHRTFDIVGPARELSVPLTDALDPTQRFVGAACLRDGVPVPFTFRVVPGVPRDASAKEEGAPSAGTDGGAAGAQAGGNATANGMAAMMAALAAFSRSAPSGHDRLVFDAPEGVCQLVVICTSRKTDYNPEYINMVDKASCDTLIEAIYEPHFAHVGDEFGKTILGFFSDEPGFANEKGGTDAEGCSDSLIGKATMPLPWSAELERRLRARLGCDAAADGQAAGGAADVLFWGALAQLWGHDEVGARARHTYMDVATELYRECFDENIGSWCRAHGVMHIGHVIEDKGAHERLGSGAGHYFRAIAGQDMAGVDIVINQLVPGMDQGLHSYGRGVWDMAFFNYMLPKLGSSAAHLDPKKQGRCMAEVFGAFGWHEGLREMKWIADHFLVRGVNYFVPHAFSMGAFPDGDCPPHFYAHGNNPQFRHFGHLMTYMNRMSTLLAGGTAHPVAAVLYDADAAWAGAAQPVQRVCRELTRAQIDFDIVPEETFADGTRYAVDVCPQGFGFSMNGQRYRCLVIPRRAFVGAATLAFCQRLVAAGVPVIAVDELPGCCYDGTGAVEAGYAPIVADAWTGTEVAALDDLAAAIRATGRDDVRSTEKTPWLRVYHYTGATEAGAAGEEYYFCVNEHPRLALATTLLARDGSDALTPLAGMRVDVLDGGERAFDGALALAPYESCLIVARHGDATASPTAGSSAASGASTTADRASTAAGDTEGASPTAADGATDRSHLAATADALGADVVDATTREPIVLVGPWRVAHAGALAYPVFGDERSLDALVDLTQDVFPGTAGTYRYRCTFTLDTELSGAALDLGEAGETAEAWLDGAPLGVRIAPPYRFAAGDLAAGAHELEIEVINTVDHEMCDFFSLSEPAEPTGILGPVTIA